jgi:uncharacterized membrane protein
MDDNNNIEQVLEELNQGMTKLEKDMDDIEKEGIKNTLKYFDRIHDKLFTLNNMFIAAYFVIIVIPNSNTSTWLFLVPILNMLFLLYIDYRLLKRSRFQSAIKSKSSEDINKQTKEMDKTNLYSFLTIWTTIIVTLIFMFQFYHLF